MAVAYVSGSFASETIGFLGGVVAIVLAAALIGYLSFRLRIVPIVGFLIAGAVIGPNALGLVREPEVVEIAAEFGVILLLFSIGLEFSLEQLARIKRLILLGGGLQVLLATGGVLAVLAALGIPWQVGAFTGMLVSLSSTAIVLKLLASRGQTNTERGQATLAFLLFQDLAIVVMVLIIPFLGQGGGSVWDILRAIGTAAAVIVVVLVVARKVMPSLLAVVARTCSPELFLLAIVAICFGTAFVTNLAGVSVSLGAFLAGLLVSESEHSEHAIGEIMPLQILFSATFFVSIGMFLDLPFVLSHLPLVAAGVGAILLVKTLASWIPARLLGLGTGSATAVSLLLVPIGEFSFVLERTGSAAGLSPAGLGQEGSQAFIAVTVLLMAATPLLGGAGNWLGDRWSRRAPSRRAADPATRNEDRGRRHDHVLISGYGSSARHLAAELALTQMPFTVITLSPEGAAEARRLSYDVVLGDPSKTQILQHAGVVQARMIVIPDDEHEMTAQVATLARQLNPKAVIVSRPIGLSSVEHLSNAGIDHIVDPDLTSSVALTSRVHTELGLPTAHPHNQSLDTSRVFRLTVAKGDGCEHTRLIHPVLPLTAGCAECLRMGTTWVHLRICLTCGHVGCCDSSTGRHAHAHFTGTGHGVVQSAEPGESWGWCFADERLFEHQS
ncbi:cation:proton antiporter [Nonomuraea sp. NBC_00507]|uniref:cation:proton antiporter n=1 Tax=Nonomuraea sp. NBC_00507 TaxID=2976002 RepID=UPI002E18FE1C